MYDDEAADESQNERLEELRSFVAQQIEKSSSYIDSELSNFREKASNLYYGRPYGDEVEGQSTVVSRDVMEVIEWMLAQLLRTFIGDKFCEFEPFGPDDVEGCEQQTDYVNHVLMQECEGTMLFYAWFKEALMHRFGVVHWGYCEKVEPVYETYTGLSDEQFAAVLMDGAELAEHSMRQEAMPDGSPVVLHDLRIRRVNRDKKLKVEAIPGEEFFIDSRARALDEAIAVGHKTRKSKSDLRAEGVPESVLERLGGDEGNDNDSEAIARNVAIESTDEGSESEPMFWRYTVYVRFDLDGDGLSERLRIRYVGSEIVEVEPVMDVPYAVICPVPTPHRFIGLSYTDVIEDIQRIKTILWRQGLDNLYFTNKPQREVVKGKVDVKDLETARVGGIIRVAEPGSVRDLQVPSALPATLQMVQYIDNVREERTGTSAASQGRDADQIHDTAKGMAQMVSQAQMRVELVARLFAEGGVKRLFVGLYNAIVRNQDPPRMVRLRGKFVEVNPTDWRERNNAVVTVGLGVGTKEAQMANLQGVLGIQTQLMSMGLCTPEKIHHTASKIIQTAGYNNVGSFLAAPGEVPPPPPPPPPESIVIAGIQKQIEDDKRKVDVAKGSSEEKLKLAQIESNRQLELAKLQASEAEKQRAHELKLAEMAQKSEQFYDKLRQDLIVSRAKPMDPEQAREESEKDEESIRADE